MNPHTDSRERLGSQNANYGQVGPKYTLLAAERQPLAGVGARKQLMKK